MNPKRILVRLPNWVGDIMMARPAAQAIRDRWPGAESAGMVREPHRALADRLGVFDRLLTVPAAAGLSRAATVWGAQRVVRSFRPDTAVVMAPSFEAALVVWLAGVPRRIGHATDRRGPLLTEVVPARPDAHRTEEYADLARALDATEPGRVPGLDLTPADRAYAARLFRSVGWPDDCRPVFVNPAAAKRPRAWSSGRFRVLVERLVDAGAGRRVVVHARPPFESAPEWAARRQVALAGDATLPELAALLERCALYVGNDSGPAHLAAAAGIPTVTIFGSSTPGRTGPRSSSRARHVAVSAAFACAPCRERFFDDCPSPPTADGRPPCLDAIAVDTVVGSVERILSPASP